MTKAKRVFEIAKELGTSSNAVVAKCQAEGVSGVTNHMSTVKTGLEPSIRDWFVGRSELGTSGVVHTPTPPVLGFRPTARERWSNQGVGSTRDTQEGCAQASQSIITTEGQGRPASPRGTGCTQGGVAHDHHTRDENRSMAAAVQEVLSTHAPILDTCFAFHSGFGDFIAENRSVFEGGRLLVPPMVIAELSKFACETDTNRWVRAVQAIALLQEMSAKNLSRPVGDDSKAAINDGVVLELVQRMSSTDDLVILTNDVDLMLDVRSIKRQRSTRGSIKRIEVVKLHARTQRPVIFRPHRSW